MTTFDPPGDTPSQQLFAVVLAAGTSSRFGSTKQLIEFDGLPLVVRATRLATEVFGEHCILVAGKDWRDVAGACKPLRGFLVVNSEFGNGLGGSIAAGVAAVSESAGGVMLLLADQPLIDAGHLRQMVSTWRQDPRCVVASEFAATVGPPVIFPAGDFDALIALNRDRGAREVLRKTSSRVTRIRCDAAAIDIDSPSDLASLIR